jgi:hypothetical protein
MLNHPHGSKVLASGYCFQPIEDGQFSIAPIDAYFVSQGTYTAPFSPTSVTAEAVSEG